jgi:hypothetical protein
MINLFENPTIWTDDFETILKNVAFNSSLMSQHHKKKYKTLDRRLKYYKLPIIILSGINSILSIGLSQFLDQNIVSVLNCLISLIISIIGSIELYLQINKKSESEEKAYRSFYLLTLEINTTLKLEPNHRDQDPQIFTNDIVNKYKNLFSESGVNGLTNDQLINIS